MQAVEQMSEERERHFDRKCYRTAQIMSVIYMKLPAWYY